MNAEHLFLSSLLSSIVLLIISIWRRSRFLGALCCFSGLWTLVTLIIWTQQKPPAIPEQRAPEPPDVQPAQLVDFRPIEFADEGYVTSKVCRQCHMREHAAWHESYHRTMTQVPTPETAIGDFANRSVTVADRTYRFQKKGELLWVSMNNPYEETVSEETRSWCPITLSTGSHHMQIYWFSVGPERLLSQVPLVYLAKEQDWVPRRSVFLLPPGEPISTELGRWNETCIGCHTTRGKPRVFDASHVDSLVTEFGISCEACHGPGERHVRFHESAGPPSVKNPAIKDPIVNPAHLSHELSSQVCGQCHSVTNSIDREQLDDFKMNGVRFHPGEQLNDSLRVIRRDEETREYLREFDQFKNDEAAIDEFLDQTFWPDGMVRVSGREYNGISESICHQKGEMACISCHKLHKSEDDPRSFKEWANDQLGVGMESDRACTQCHQESSYAQTSHTHHALESSGSRCYNCHMPYTSYGLLKAIRSHQIDSPNVTRSMQSGRPNACNLCHLDQTSEWSARHLFEWHGTEIPHLNADQKTISASVLKALTGDAGQRALIAYSMGWEQAVEVSGADWIPLYLITLLEDPYDAVRFIAARSLRKRKGFEDFEYDFVSSEEERHAAAEHALKIWKSRTLDPSSDKAHVLIGSDGDLLQETIQRLKSQRDDREIRLAE